MNSTFKALSDASFKMGENLNKRSGGNVSPSRFAGVAGAVKASGQGQSGDINLGGLEKLGPITTTYGGSTNIEGYHPGVDIGTPTGTKIPSPISGTIVDERTGMGWTGNKPSYGNYVVIRDSKGNYHRFSHLSNTYVPLNTNVNKGDVIGESGFSGSTYSSSSPNKPGPHIDYRIYSTSDLSSKIAGAAKKYFDPSDYLKNYIE